MNHINLTISRMKIPKSFYNYHSLFDDEIKEFCKLNKINLIDIYMNNDTKKYRTGAYVFNLDKTTGQGTHWTSSYNSIRKNLYFDPFGMLPSEEIKNFLKTKQKIVEVNTTQIQDISSISCGYFVCLWLYLMSKKISFYSFIHSLFSFDTIKNEGLIKKIFRVK